MMKNFSLHFSISGRDFFFYHRTRSIYGRLRHAEKQRSASSSFPSATSTCLPPSPKPVSAAFPVLPLSIQQIHQLPVIISIYPIDTPAASHHLYLPNQIHQLPVIISHLPAPPQIQTTGREICRQLEHRRPNRTPKSTKTKSRNLPLSYPLAIRCCPKTRLEHKKMSPSHYF